MKKLEICLLCLLLCLLCLAGCSRYERVEVTSPAPVVVSRETGEAETEEGITAEPAEETAGEQETTVIEVTTQEETEPPLPERVPVKVKGIYLTGYVAGSPGMFDEILSHIEQTEINAVVIDVKNDEGRVTFAMDSPLVNEVGSVKKLMDIESVMAKLKERGIYTIARIVAFRDPYLPEQRPEWGLKLADGSLYRDRNGLAWVNPYKREVWDYLAEIAMEAHKAGFDEVQFDYIRFSTERGIDDVVYDEADTGGLSRTEIITEFVNYIYEKCLAEGVYLAADVFGTVIGGGIDSDNVGQSYGDMAAGLDYICPMIYPSHYADGNFGIEHPDTQPYDTILAALQGSKAALSGFAQNGEHQAVVRPWLQDFTASYLENYIDYGPEQVRAEIQAVYDAGYDEWMLWSAACRYHWDGLLTPEEADAEMRELEAERTARAQSEAAAQTQSETAAETQQETAAEAVPEETSGDGDFADVSVQAQGSGAEESGAEESEAEPGAVEG